MKTCSATTKDGNPCKMRPLAGSEPPTCFNHAPGAAADEARAKARKAGGELHGKQQGGDGEDAPGDESWSALYTTADLEIALAHVARETIAGRMSSRQASASVAALKQLQPIVEDAERRGQRKRYVRTAPEGYDEDDSEDGADE